MLEFFCGLVVGVVLVVVLVYLILFEGPFTYVRTERAFVEQFQPLRLPKELKIFLNGCDGNDATAKWEPCFNLSLILHFLFQEHKDTRRLRRWIHKKLQLELSDLTTRSAAGRLIQVRRSLLNIEVDIRIRNLSVGSKSPVIKAVRVESYEISKEESFKTLNLLVDVDYTGGFQTSIDVTMLFGRFAQLSVKLARVSGQVRLKLTREPFTHWAFAFINMPILDFQIDSQWQGKQVKHLVPLITQQFRRAFQRKHVWPNYKIRYRPLFPNPLFMPSPSTGAFEHIAATGVLEVTVLWCTRLNTALVECEESEIYCELTVGNSTVKTFHSTGQLDFETIDRYLEVSKLRVGIDQRPLMQNASRGSTRCVTILLNFNRRGSSEPIGMTFSKLVSDAGVRSVQVSTVQSCSAAERSGFKPGDVVLAVNNVLVTNERQLSKLLSGNAGELNVLIDRTINEEADTEQNTITNDGKSLKKAQTDSFSSSEFEEIVIPEDLEKNRTKQSKLKKGCRRRSQSTTSLNLPITSRDWTNVSSKYIKLFESCTSSESCSILPKNLLKNTDFVSVGQRQHSEQDNVFRKIINLRRVRSEAEIAKKFTSSRKSKHTLTNSLENLLDLAQKTLEKVSSNVIENNSLASTTNVMQTHSMDNLSIDNATEISSEDFVRSPSRRERLQIRAAEMAAAGKARMSEFLYRHRNAVPSSEVAFDALLQTDTCSRSPSPLLFSEKKKKNPFTKTKRHTASQNCATDGSRKSSDASPRTLTTKSLRINKDVLWGQSLHFNLDTETSKFLNVVVRTKSHVGANVGTTQDKRKTAGTDSQVLGYISIYIPQLLDDCQLTLSNCHRETFTLRPPFWNTSRRPLTPKAFEESRRAGFDERLCYGDIVLGFRYFPDGLPADVKNSSGVELMENVSLKNTVNTCLETSTGAKHHFETTVLKGSCICAVCRGKVWLKSASHCTGCFLLCHNKCISKVDTACSQHCPVDDSVVENILDSNEFASNYAENNSKNEQIAAEVTSPETGPVERTLTRRSRIAVKVSEKISSTWKSVGRKKTSSCVSKEHRKEKNEWTSSTVSTGTSDVVPVQKAIPDVFSLLKISGNLSQMMYQPGNAYNEHMIGAAKLTGKNMFTDLDPAKRKKKVNEDMEKIQNIIDRTTAERLEALENMKDENAQRSNSIKFAHLDDRLQALAVLMLHYCAALQNCVDLEESSKCQNKDSADATQDNPDVSILTAENARIDKNGCLDSTSYESDALLL